MAGKTELRARIGHQATPTRKDRTQELRAYVFGVNQDPLRFLAVLDGAGEAYHQQFDITSKADFLVVVLDHNRSDKEVEIEPGRRDDHVDFSAQLIRYLREKENSISRIELLLNKKDLWGGKPFEGKFTDWFEEQVRIWRTGFPKVSVNSRTFSNENPEDLVKLLQTVASQAKRVANE